jgi:probable rRNA maturation factor
MISFSYQVLVGADNLDDKKNKRWLKDVISREGKKTGDIQYVFCDDNYLAAINKSFLNHDTFTDIITFPTTDNPDLISGEIYISMERVNENSKKNSVSFSEELSRVILHGILHLIGYKDYSDSEKKLIRGKEDYYLHLQR